MKLERNVRTRATTFDWHWKSIKSWIVTYVLIHKIGKPNNLI